MHPEFHTQVLEASLAPAYVDRERSTAGSHSAIGEASTLPSHRWHDLSAIQPDEVLLIKCFDTAESGRARRMPTAFIDPTTPDKDPPRESLELRTLVCHHA